MKNLISFFLFLALGLGAFQMKAQSAHVQSVLQNFAAFGKGDIPTILSSLAPDCSWYHAGNPAILPFAGTVHGPEEVGAKFFAVIPTVLEITSFEPSIVGEEGNTVVSSVKIQGRVLATGKTYTSDNEMRWTFDDKGKIVKYENLFDTSALEAAFSK